MIKQIVEEYVFKANYGDADFWIKRKIDEGWLVVSMCTIPSGSEIQYKAIIIVVYQKNI